jgi:hypothetical protein
VRRRTFNSRLVCACFLSASRRRSRVACNRCWADAHCNPTTASPTERARLWQSFAPHRPPASFQRPNSFLITLPKARFLQLAFLAAFPERASCDARFLQPFNRTLLATRVSCGLSRARFLRRAFLAAFPEHASCDWRFSPSSFQEQTSYDSRFFQPFNRTLLATRVSLRLPFKSLLLATGVSFGLSRAHFLPRAFLSAFQPHVSFG